MKASLAITLLGFFFGSASGLLAKTEDPSGLLAKDEDAKPSLPFSKLTSMKKPWKGQKLVKYAAPMWAKAQDPFNKMLKNQDNQIQKEAERTLHKPVMTIKEELRAREKDARAEKKDATQNRRSIKREHIKSLKADELARKEAVKADKKDVQQEKKDQKADNQAQKAFQNNQDKVWKQAVNDFKKAGLEHAQRTMQQNLQKMTEVQHGVANALSKATHSGSNQFMKASQQASQDFEKGMKHTGHDFMKSQAEAIRKSTGISSQNR